MYTESLLVACIVVVVSATVGETLRQIPMEISSLWFHASQNVTARLITSVFSVPDPADPVTYLKVVLMVAVGYQAWALCLRPLNRVKKLGSVGYLAEGSLSIKETANMVQKKRKMGAIPPPFPNGWFGLMEGFKLKKGESQSVTALGELCSFLC